MGKQPEKIENTPENRWRKPLMIELGILVAVKLVILFVIKQVWFDNPVVPKNGTVIVTERTLGIKNQDNVIKESSK